MVKHIKSNDQGKKINLEGKLNYREKLKAKKEYEKRVDEEFTEKTGIRNESEDFELSKMVANWKLQEAEWDL